MSGLAFVVQVSLGKTYNGINTGVCTQLDALKEADRIFLGRAMNKNWKNTESKVSDQK
jgi:hypothetical protein